MFMAEDLCPNDGSGGVRLMWGFEGDKNGGPRMLGYSADGIMYNQVSTVESPGDGELSGSEPTPTHYGRKKKVRSNV